jgi:hypothetical protein
MSERLSEPERTSSAAIVATRVRDRVHVYGFRVYPDAVMKASANAR